MKQLKFKMNNALSPLRKHYHTSYFKTLFTTYLLIFTFLLVGFLSIFTFTYNKWVREDAYNFNAEIIQQSQQTTTTLLSDVYNQLLSSVLSNAYVLNLLYSQEPTPNDSINGANFLKSILYSSSYIHSIEIINYNQNTILTVGATTYSYSSENSDFYDEITNSTPSLTPVFFRPRIITSINGTVSPCASLIVHQLKSGVLIVNIDVDIYEDMLNITNNNESDLYIVNKEQMITFTNQSDKFNTNVSEDPIFKAILNENESSGLIYLPQNLSYVQYIKDAPLGFTYYSVFKISAFQVIMSMLALILPASLLFIIFMIGITFGVSKWLYKPIFHLKESIQNSTTEYTPELNEFEYYTKAYANIISENEHLSHTLKSFKHYEINSVISKLIVSPQDITSDENITLHNLFTQPLCRVFIMNIDSPESFCSAKNDITLLQYAITNIFSELIEPIISNIHHYYEPNRIIYILNFSEDNKVLLEHNLDQLQTLVLDYFKTSLSIGIGSISDNLEELTTSYSAANSALDQKFLFGKGSILWFEQLQWLPPNEQLYPTEQEQKILAALKKANIQSASEHLETFIEIIQKYSSFYATLYIVQLRNSIIEFIYSKDILLTVLLDINFTSMMDTTVFDIKSEFLKLFSDIVSYMSVSTKSNSEKSVITEKVHKIIDDNIYDNNLCVLFIANEISLSANYLRSIYKDVEGESLSNYITQKRIEIICQLLTEQDWTVQEIIDKLGFTSRNYFFTFFKKHTGMTPSQYQKQSQTKESQ